MTLCRTQPKPKTIRLKGKALENLRREVFERDRGFCQQCGVWVSWKDGHMAHIKSRGAGGEDAMENTVWKCPYCHIFLEHTKGEKDKTMKPEIEDALREMAKDIPEEEWDKFQKYIIRSKID